MKMGKGEPPSRPESICCVTWGKSLNSSETQVSFNLIAIIIQSTHHLGWLLVLSGTIRGTIQFGPGR